MKRSVFHVLLALSLLSGLLATGAVAAPRNESATESWIVVLKEGVSSAQAADSLARAHGGDIGHVYSHALNGFSIKAAPQVAAALENNPLVERVVADREVHALDTVPTGVSRIDAQHPSGYNVPGRSPAHGAGYTGDGAYIAVLDTGVDSDHPDLDVDVSAGKACITSTTEDVDGHGTHVAGSAAALDNGIGVVGVAPDATVIPVKVLGDTGSGTWSSLICGVDHVTALANGQVPGVTIGGPIVANVSLSGPAGGPDDGVLQDAISASVNAGVPYIAAAGNASANAQSIVPAKFPEVITVSALTDFDGEPGGNDGCETFWNAQYCDDTFADFSNYGSAVDVIAPGVIIESTVPTGYGSNSGTSMASPHVAGVAALILAEDDTLDPDDVRLLLQETGECPNGAWNTGGATCTGQGQWSGDPDGTPEPLVNAYRALDDVTTTLETMRARLWGSVDNIAGGKWTAQATISLRDTDRDPVVGAHAWGYWHSGGSSTPASCVTGTSGTCTVVSPTMQLTIPSTTFTFASATHPNYVISPASQGLMVTNTRHYQ